MYDSKILGVEFSSSYDTQTQVCNSGNCHSSLMADGGQLCHWRLESYLSWSAKMHPLRVSKGTRYLN